MEARRLVPSERNHMPLSSAQLAALKSNAAALVAVANALENNVAGLVADVPPTPSPLAIDPMPSVSASVGASVSIGLGASGGTPPYTFEAAGLPIGLSVNGAAIVGTPTTAGTSHVAVAAVDSANATSSTNFTLTVAAVAPPVVSPHAPVFLIMMETYGFSDLQGNSQAPYINSLFTNFAVNPFTALGHNSAPNYVCMVSGIDCFNSDVPGTSTPNPDFDANIIGDSVDTRFDSRTTIFDQCHSAGLQWAVYAESGAAEYRLPYSFFPHLTVLQAQKASTVLPADLDASNPAFSLYIPNNTNNMHSSSIAAGDAFLASFVPQLQATNWYKNGGQIVIAWDEQDSAFGDSTTAPNGGTVCAIVVSNAAANRGVQNTQCTTAGVLGSFEDSLGFARIATAALPGAGGLGALLGASVAPQPPTPPPPASLVPLGAAVAPNGTWTLKLDDEFSGTTLNAANWSTGWFGSGVTVPVDTTNELCCYDPAQVVVNNGLSLNLIAKQQTVSGQVFPYSTGCVTSNGKQQFSFGFFEAKITLPAASPGVIANWPAWWTDGQNWPTDGEIDILEGLSGGAAYHFHFGSPANPSSAGADVPGDFTGTHTYGCNWQPGRIDYYYDGTLVGSVTTGVTSQPMYMILVNTTSVPGVGGPVVAPASMQVEYVRVWQ